MLTSWACQRGRHYSFQDYLTVEEMNPGRHEFLDGEVYAMAAGTMLHAALSAAVLTALATQLAGRCRTYTLFQGSRSRTAWRATPM